jgi:hypothetical protein
MVAALLPAGARATRDAALASFRDNAQEQLQVLYDEIAPGAIDLEEFNFLSPDDARAPHAALGIVWHEGLRNFDPRLDSELGLEESAWGALRPFCESALRFIDGDL